MDNKLSEAIGKVPMVTIELTKREASLLWSMMKIAVELSGEGSFPMSEQTIVDLFPVADQIAIKVDKLNGVSQFNV